MSKIINAVKQLKDLKTFVPATDKDIRSIELDLHVYLSDEYKEYLKNFGAVLADNVELTGFAKSECRNVVKVTTAEWEKNPGTKEKKMYVIENVGIDGIIIWQDQSGAIYETHPDAAAEKIADSMADYLFGKR